MWQFLEEFGNEGSAIGGIGAFVLFVFGPVWWFFTRKTIPKVELANPEALTPPTPVAPPDNTLIMNLDTFAAMQERALQTARKQFAQSHGEDRARLQDQIDALNARLADPERALAEQQAIIRSLEEQLARRGNDIGGDDLATARAALQAGDFTAARALFESLAARTEPDVKSAPTPPSPLAKSPKPKSAGTTPPATTPPPPA